jgi:energy-coupling factor transporter ATP-binding protein EcfA2
MQTPDAPFLVVDELSFRFPPAGVDAGPVLDGVKLDIPRGATGVVLGRADAGKSTLARIISGLVPRFTGGAIAGSVAAGGRLLRGVPPYDLVQVVGLVAQDSEEQLLTTRCDTEVAFALESLGLSRQQMRRQVAESLERAGLAGFEHRNPATLSGGEKKRLLLACLDAVRPELWILDEALGELDFEWRSRAMDLIIGRGGTTLLMESRWTALVEQRGTSFFLLEAGRVRARAADNGDQALRTALASAGIRPAHAAARRPAQRDGALVAEGLKFRFDGSQEFRLEIGRLELAFGEVTALVGRNGSGKSTLGRILCGLLRPQEGQVCLASAGGTRRVRPEELASHVGYLFQNPDHQIFLPTVREELALGLRARGLEQGEAEARVQEAAERFRLPDLEAPPALLSYGARRRLQAAAYYLLSRDLLILDEIDSGLSYGEIQSLLDMLCSRTPGLVLITHDMVLARMASHRVLVMEAGRITRGASPDGVA